MTRDTESVVAASAEADDDALQPALFHQLVLDRSHDLIAVVAMDGRIVYASPSWSRLGWDAEEIVTTPILELVHPDDLARAGRALADVAGGCDVESVVLRLRTRDGRWVAVDSTEIPIRGPHGEVAYVLPPPATSARARS